MVFIVLCKQSAKKEYMKQDVTYSCILNYVNVTHLAILVRDQLRNNWDFIVNTEVRGLKN